MEKQTVARTGFSLVWRRRNQLLAGYKLEGANEHLENFVKFTFPEIFHNKEMLNRFNLIWDRTQFQHQPQGKKLVPT